MSGLVHDTITGQVVGYGIAGPVKWIYDPADPHAVMMDLSVLCTEPEQQGQVVQWTFARSILVRGLVGGQAGIGDVRITRNGPWLDIALTSPDGHGVFRFPAATLHRFVVRTERVVLIGDESRHMAATLDDAVARLLGGVS